MNDPLQKSLDEKLASLARAIPPPRNLWPGIRRRLDERARPRRPMVFAAAACIVGACAASALTWAVLRGSTGLQPQAGLTAHAPARAAAPAFDEPRTASYVTARDDLELNFRERLALLDPATRAQIESSLAVIRLAHDDITKALASDPASPLLEQLWQSTWHDELDLYDHVVRATQPTLTRT
jgi:hypothetical protein